LKRDSTNAEMKTSLAAARAAAATRSDVEVDWSSDSDGDQNVWSLASYRSFISDDVSATATAGYLGAGDAVRHATRALGELALAASGDVLRGSAALGVRSLNADTQGVPDRTVLTARATGSAHLGMTNVSLSVAHFPFDEIASLIAREIDLTAVDANVDVAAWTRGTLGLSAGTLGFSDGNRRTNFTIRAAQHWTDRPWVGLFARSMSFAEHVIGYFSPGQFYLYEAQGGWDRDIAGWSYSVGGGFGSQQVDAGKPWQSEYHAEGRIARRWKSGSTLGVTGGVSTSAASSAVGAYKYSTLGINASIAW
jgi:hypothetical protein